MPNIRIIVFSTVGFGAGVLTYLYGTPETMTNVSAAIGFVASCVGVPAYLHVKQLISKIRAADRPEGLKRTARHDHDMGLAKIDDYEKFLDQTVPVTLLVAAVGISVTIAFDFAVMVERTLSAVWMVTAIVVTYWSAGVWTSMLALGRRARDIDDAERLEKRSNRLTTTKFKTSNGNA